MAKSKTQTEVIRLGRQFVKELNLGRSNDTFSRWMAHYLAEKIKAAESAVGEKKVKAQKDCSEVIMKLWAHRSQLPSGKRPFENFDEVFDFIKRLAPEKETPFYFVLPGDRERKRTGSKWSQEWLEIAEQVDRGARVCIEYALKKATLEVKDKKTDQWLKAISNLTSDIDVKTIRILVDRKFSFGLDDEGDPDVSKIDEQREYAIERVNNRIEELERFSTLNERILESLRQDLKELCITGA